MDKIYLELMRHAILREDIRVYQYPCISIFDCINCVAFWLSDLIGKSPVYLLGRPTDAFWCALLNFALVVESALAI